LKLAIALAFLPTAAWAQAPTTTADFVKTVAMSDMLEIQSSQLALGRSPDADTKPFAEKMVKELDELKAKSGKDFDAAYDRLQLQTHQEAVALFEQYARSGDNADLKAWALKTLPHLKEHLAMAKRLS
jgi:putative membrane protein